MSNSVEETSKEKGSTLKPFAMQSRNYSITKSIMMQQDLIKEKPEQTLKRITLQILKLFLYSVQ
uniref:Uncharacterized protein n=1 Tax=Rhizophora mucronata TaxID=61149 RepID=A0A2P2NDH8_RHIMU